MSSRDTVTPVDMCPDHSDAIRLVDPDKHRSRNDITGDYMNTKANTKEYEKGYDLIDWSKK